ncbi:MAG: surface antigen [Verrucomicrobiales bacterium]|nr:surface antigen [Verrucomicrobiales bacterium]
MAVRGRNEGKARHGLRYHPLHRQSNLIAFLFIFASLLFRLPTLAAGTNHLKPAVVKVSGNGWLLGDRRMKQMLRTLEGDDLKREFLDAGTIEDSALILVSQLRKEGYLKPSVVVELTLADGRKDSVRWSDRIEPPLPRDLKVRKAHFKLKKGVLYHFEDLKFEGLKSIREKNARGYFVETGVLLHLRSTRVFTPDRLNRGLNNLVEELQRLGFEQAVAKASGVEQNPTNGAVRVLISVQEGLKSRVRSLRVERLGETQLISTNQVYSTVWLQDFVQSLKATNYHRGYPDTKVTVTNLSRTVTSSNVALLDLLAQVNPGSLVHIGSVQFQGQTNTRMSTLTGRVPLHHGDLLDRVKAEEGRTRLARLGVFDSVRLSYDREDEETRDVIYEVREAKRTEVNLLFGYGSYELLRGGFQIEQYNLFGLAHHAQLRAIQSFKASRGDFTYTIPEMVGQDIDFVLNGFWLRREEVSFTRQEYGGGAGLHRFFKPIATDVNLRYNYQVLNASELDPNLAAVGPLNPSVGAIILDVRHDRRDNPLYPSRGYKIFGTLESGSQYLAGDVNYERLEIAASFHQPLGGGRMLSLGLSHGLAAALGASSLNLPFNKRFFPGGESSIRGYQDGEAAPRDAFGRIIGAETYVLGTVEMEQAITAKWSIVAFSDSIGFAQAIRAYPFDENLYSVGGGLRWKTIVGPVRVEYGHNLNPRPGDPKGTLHFSLGFPF